LTRSSTSYIQPGIPVVTLGIAAVIVVAAVPFLSWVAYLLFCGWLVGKSNDPASLRDAAVAARAFRVPGPSAAPPALAKLVGLMKGGR